MKTLQEIEKEFKECKCCKTYKRFCEFGKLSHSDKLRNECKKCSSKRNSKDNKIRIENNPECHKKQLEYLRNYHRENEKEKERNKSKHKKYKKYRDPIKEKARDSLNHAIKRGDIKRLPCVICGDIKSEGHHEDYYKPLDVIWLCITHHNEIHRKFNDLRQNLGL